MKRRIRSRFHQHIYWPLLHIQILCHAISISKVLMHDLAPSSSTKDSCNLSPAFASYDLYQRLSTRITPRPVFYHSQHILNINGKAVLFNSSLNQFNTFNNQLNFFINKDQCVRFIRDL